MFHIAFCSYFIFVLFDSQCEVYDHWIVHFNSFVDCAQIKFMPTSWFVVCGFSFILAIVTTLYPKTQRVIKLIQNSMSSCITWEIKIWVRAFPLAGANFRRYGIPNDAEKVETVKKALFSGVMSGWEEMRWRIKSEWHYLRQHWRVCYEGIRVSLITTTLLCPINKRSKETAVI